MKLATSRRPPRVALFALALAALVGAATVVLRASSDQRAGALAPAASSLTPAARSRTAPAARPDERSAPEARRDPAPSGERQLDVRILDGAGEPRPRALVRLAQGDDGPHAWTTADDDGRVTLAPPAGNFALEATAAGQPLRRVGVAPLDPGERRALELVLDNPTVVLLGSATWPDGRPLADVDLELSLRAGGPSPRPSRRRARTDAGGGFRFELERRYADRPLEQPLLELLRDGGRRTRLTAELPPLAPRLGENPLGRFVLSETPVVLAGRLEFDGPGRAVGLRLERGGPDGDWREVRGLEQFPGPDDAFELRGRPQPGAFRLVVEAPQYVPLAPIPVALGQRDLQIPLVPGGLVQVRLLADEPLQAELTPEVVAAGAGHGRGGRQKSWAGGPGNEGEQLFSWSGLPEGTWTLRIFRAQADQPLLALAGLRVEPSRPADDPRLAGIDLRAR